MSNSDSDLRHGSWPPPADAKPIPPSSWAKKTGFKPKFSGETNASDSGQIINILPHKVRQSEPQPQPELDLEAGCVRPPANGVAQSNNVSIPVSVPVVKEQTVKKRRDSDGVPSTNGQANPAPVAEQPPQVRRVSRQEEMVDGLVVDDEGLASRHPHMKYELRDSPGLGSSWSCFGNLEF